jgi:hypothetical protein
VSFDVDFERRGNYLCARVSGTNSAETVLGYMGAIKVKCEEENCFSVLIEEKLDGPRFDEMQIFALISDGSPDALGFFDALAYVDEQQDFDRVRFAETVAVNRGIPVAVFQSVPDAENWLRNRVTDEAGADFFHGRAEDGEIS